MSGSGRGITVAIIATTLLWLSALVGLGFWALRRDVTPIPLVIGPAEPVVPTPSGGPPAPPTALPQVPPVPPPGTAPSRVKMTPTEAHLDEQLRAEVVASEASGRRVVVFFTAAWCQPCHAVERTLAAADVQAQLGSLQLVEVDVDAFSTAELRRAGALLLDQDVEAIPLFCALRSSQPPVCVDGGAWGEDTDSNIRTILVPFLASPPSGVSPRGPDRITPI